MVTQRLKAPKRGKKPAIPVKPVRRAFYLKEWRKFMGTKAIDLAVALDIERESYYRLERNWWTISTGEQDLIAEVIGIKPSQLWFPPPKKGQPEVLTVEELMEDIPQDMQPAAILALRGMARR